MGQELPSSTVPQTFMPSIITSLILIKNLRIKWDNSQSDWDSHAETNSASVSVGYGPFAVNGHYNHHDEQRNFSCQFDGEYLTVEGVQLVGYVSMINPASPGVDSASFLQKAAAQPSNTTSTTITAAAAPAL
jgi:hypothetical protein